MIAGDSGRIRFRDLSSSVVLGDEVRGRVSLSPELDGVDEVTVGLSFETAGSCDPAARPGADVAPRWTVG